MIFPKEKGKIPNLSNKPPKVKAMKSLLLAATNATNLSLSK